VQAALEVAERSRGADSTYNLAVSRIYTLRDANAMVPEMAIVVQRLRDQRDEVAALRDAYLRREAILMGETDFDAPLASSPGIEARRAPEDDVELTRLRLRTRGLVDQMQADAAWLDERSIVLRDISTGLLDFPAETDDGLAIWLCWRLGEGEITAWHTHDEGFAGRRPIEDLRAAR
jgi:hypothetical protein